MYTLGIDIGSSSSKAVLLKNGSEIIAEDAIQAGTGSKGNIQGKNVSATICLLHYAVRHGTADGRSL